MFLRILSIVPNVSASAYCACHIISQPRNMIARVWRVIRHTANMVRTPHTFFRAGESVSGGVFGWKRVLPIILLLAIGSAAPVSAAEFLDEAHRALSRGEYDAAIEMASPYLDSMRPAWAQGARLITAEAQIELGRFAESIRTLSPLIGDAPPGPSDSAWVVLLARALQGQGLVLEAADWWLTHASFGRQQRDVSHRYLVRLLGGELTQPELAYLLWKYPGNDLLCDAHEEYARQEARRGHTREALRAWETRPENCGPATRPATPPATRPATPPATPPATRPATPPATRPDNQPRWLERLSEEPGANDFFTVGLLAPLKGSYASFGIALSNGADVARRLHNANARFPLRLEIADTGGSPEGCIAAVKRLHGQGVRLFIGEVFSLNTLMAAAYLQGRDAVLISPAATDSTVRFLGTGTYGCTVGPYEQAEAVLTYAADSLSIRRVALLYPFTADGQRWAQLGRDIAQRRGIRIVYDRSYIPGTTDFSDLLARARPVIPDSLDALLCPGQPRELAALLTQMAHAGFIGAYLGGPELGDPLLTRVIRDFEMKVVYPGDTYVPVRQPGQDADFETTYAELFGEPADAFARRGFAAFGLVGAAVERGGYCPAVFAEIMERVSGPARGRGEGRRLQMAPEVALPELHFRLGDRNRLAGPALGPPPEPEPPEPPGSFELLEEQEPLWLIGPDEDVPVAPADSVSQPPKVSVPIRDESGRVPPR